MANVIGLSEYHEKNLRQLAAYLLSGELKSEFNMGQFCDSGELYVSHCGTAGCAAGHGPYAGIPKRPTEDWYDYMLRVFGVRTDEELYDWTFSGFWYQSDNTPEGAAKRILWALDHGVPTNSSAQAFGSAPLCYL